MKKALFLTSLVAVIISLIALSTPPLHAQAGRAQKGLDIAIAAQERHTDAVMSLPGVVGTAVGLNASGDPVVKIFTETRGVRGLPSVVDGVPVEVEATGKIYALHHMPGHSGGPGGGGGVGPTARFDRPVPIGVSTGHPNVTAGTICCRVTDRTDVYALSNNHVYADENNAFPGDKVLQPGPYDGGVDPDDAIGTLSNFQTIHFDGTDNVIDAAIALSSPSLLGNSTPSGGYGTPKSSTAQAFINQKVKKFGRTTSQTKGVVGGINATVNVQYATGVARFVNQIIIQPGSFSAGGDSGSLIVVDDKGKNSDDRKPVGLLFAGSPFITVANPIDAVLNAFGVTIDGE